MAIKIIPSIHTPVQDQEPELRGREVTQGPSIAAQGPVLQDLKVQGPGLTPKVFLDDSPSTVGGRVTGASDRVQLQAIQNQVAAGALDPVDLDRECKAMATAVYSESAQDEFIAYLESRKASPEALTEVAATVRNSLYKSDMKLGRLRKFMSERGVKLYGNEKLPPGAPGVSLDLSAFRQRLEAIEKAGGVIDKRTARELIGSIKDVGDDRDLMEAQWLLRRRLMEGKLRFAGTDAETGAVDGYEERFFRLIDEKLGGQLNPKELAYLAKEARGAGFDGPSMERLRAAILRCKDNPDAMFFAERTVRTQIEEAKNALTRVPRKAERTIAFLEKKRAETRDPTELAALDGRIAELKGVLSAQQGAAAKEVAALERTGGEFKAFIEPLVAGKLDRRTVRKDLLKRYRAGEIGEQEAAGLMSACATSRTPEEFAYASMLIAAQMALTHAWQEMADAWDRMMEAFRQSMSEDTFDANGNVVESGLERRLREESQKRVIHELEGTSRQTKDLAKRASLQALGARARQAMPKARDGSERASLESKETAASTEQEGLQISRTPPN